MRHWLAALAVQDGAAAKRVLSDLVKALPEESRGRLWRSLAVVLRQHPSAMLRDLLPAGF